MFTVEEFLMIRDLHPIIRINPHPTLNIQDRKIFVLSANTLQYASR